MTTVDKAHEVFMSFDGRSPKQIYIDKCDELGIKSNSKLKNVLSDKVNDFYAQDELKLQGNYFGGKGMKAVLPLLLCFPRLKLVDLRGCGVTDQTMVDLTEIMLDHGRLREVDLSDNPDISVFSGKSIVKVCKANVNLISVRVSETNIGDNVAAVVERMCANNRELNESYFTDHFFRMKDMFIGLDVDGSGWVNLNTFASSVVFPFIQERLRERIAEVKPKKRGEGENSIDINTFMPLTYLTWKTKEDIDKRITEDSGKDEQGMIIKENWASLLQVLDEKGLECRDLSKIRVGGQLLKGSTVERMVDEALSKCTDEDKGDGEKKNIPVTRLFDAQRVVAPTTNKKARPSSFYSGSKKKTWAIPTDVVQELQKTFGDKPLGYPSEQVLGFKMETELHRVEFKFLKKQFYNYAIPIDDVLLTIQEIVNMVDEYWDCVRMDKKFSLDEVRAMADETNKGEEELEEELEH